MRAQGHSYTKNVKYGTLPQSRKLCDPLKMGARALIIVL